MSKWTQKVPAPISFYRNETPNGAEYGIEIEGWVVAVIAVSIVLSKVLAVLAA